MAATFRPVNSLGHNDSIQESSSKMMTLSPAASRPHTAPLSQPPTSNDDARTPLRVTFHAATDNPSRQHSEQAQLDNTNSSATTSPNRDSMDVDMEESDNEAGVPDDNAPGSDADSVNGDGSKSKKKKSQRFYCTDYPPCNLSFTRSEHLARHIRKHTGERPFQCHCSRRFSRLDNLRQHAQTVHVNEDIPIDSLAATGSRFQRQMRTDRARQAGNRARALTSGSAGGPPRGHSKSLSTSSINSINSVASIGSLGSSSYGMHPDRRRPPPLVMAPDPRSRLSVESYRSGVDSNYSYRPHSPSEFSTPTSTSFSTAQSSPRWPSNLASPTSAHSRSQSMYAPDSRTSGRRLSVPSGAPSHFQQSQALPPGRLSFGPALVNSSNIGAFSSPTHPSTPSQATPTPTPWHGRHDSTSSPSADEAWRRRTWHPDSRAYNGQQQPSLNAQSAVHPNPPPPMVAPTNSQSVLRLPGIESFDPIIQRPPTPPCRNTSPLPLDPDNRQRRMPNSHLDSIAVDDRRNLNMYDASLQRGINRLEIGHRTPPCESASGWAFEANKAVQAQGERAYGHVRFEEPPREHYGHPPSRSLHQHTMSAPTFTTGRESKHHGWYNGSTSQHRDRQPTQDGRTAHVSKMVHPNFTCFAGFPAREQQHQHHQHQHQQQSTQPPPPPPPPPQERSANSRFDALVAVATKEGSTAAAY